MVTITTTRKEVSKNKLNTKTKIITMITQIKHCGYHGLQCFQVYQLFFAKMVIIFVKGPIDLPIGCPKYALSSQTEKFIWATAFSHYLGLKYIRTTKILKIHAFFHPNQSVQSFTMYMLKIPGTQLHNMTH